MLSRHMRTMPLQVYDCRIINEPGADRREGFSEYQLIYTVSGAGLLSADGVGERRITEGDVMFLPANKPHSYRPEKYGEWKVTYVTFNGLSIADGLLRTLNFPETAQVRSRDELAGCGDIAGLFRRIAEAYAERSFIDDLTMYAYLYRLLYALYRLGTGCDEPKLRSGALGGVLEYIHRRLSDDLSVRQIAEETGTSEYFLYRSFKELYGTTPWEYITRQRLERAKELLVSRPELTLQDIGLMTGMTSKNCLSRRFKAAFGMTPGRYRKDHGGSNGSGGTVPPRSLPVFLTDADELVIDGELSGGGEGYELLFCNSGCGVLTDENEAEYFVRPGGICFLTPQSRYSLRRVEGTWSLSRIRFGGRHIQTLLKGVGLFRTAAMRCDSELVINHRYCADTVYSFSDTFDALCANAWDRSPTRIVRDSVLLYELIIYAGIASDERFEVPNEEEQLAPVIDIINMYYMRRLSTDELADAIGVSVKRLNQLFKTVCGKTPKEYVTEVRIKNAKRMLLRRRSRTVREIAESVGFSSPSRFIAVFRATEGMTPQEYRDLYQ